MGCITQFRKFLKKHHVYDQFLNNIVHTDGTRELSKVIGVSFNWVGTPEGFKYWEYLYNKWVFVCPGGNTYDRADLIRLLQADHDWLNKVKES